MNFYEGILGMPQVSKPPHLAERGGCWFETEDLKVHLGVEADFRPAAKAHPALIVDGLASLADSLTEAGFSVVNDEPLEGYERIYVSDPFGNRIELLEPHSAEPPVSPAVEPVAPRSVSTDAALAGLRFLGDRTPQTTEAEAADAFAVLAQYRDGGVYVGHWAGDSEWERHPVADEIVLVVDGDTTISYLVDEVENSAPLSSGDLVIVPRGTWHRFETPAAVKLLSVTPQPTEHSTQRPT